MKKLFTEVWTGIKNPTRSFEVPGTRKLSPLPV